MDGSDPGGGDLGSGDGGGLPDTDRGLRRKSCDSPRRGQVSDELDRLQIQAELQESLTEYRGVAEPLNQFVRLHQFFEALRS